MGILESKALALGVFPDGHYLNVFKFVNFSIRCTTLDFKFVNFSIRCTTLDFKFVNFSIRCTILKLNFNSYY